MNRLLLLAIAFLAMIATANADCDIIHQFNRLNATQCQVEAPAAPEPALAEAPVCDNPTCTCDPCLCGPACACGTAAARERSVVRMRLVRGQPVRNVGRVMLRGTGKVLKVTAKVVVAPAKFLHRHKPVRRFLRGTARVMFRPFARARFCPQ